MLLREPCPARHVIKATAAALLVLMTTLGIRLQRTWVFKSTTRSVPPLHDSSRGRVCEAW